MTSFPSLSFTSLIVLAVVLASNYPEVTCSINQSYNANEPTFSSSPALRPSEAEGRSLNATEKTVLSVTDDPPMVIVAETKTASRAAAGRRVEKQGTERATTSLRSKRSDEETMPSDSIPVVLTCGVSCTCYVLNKSMYDQYRVICNNTKQEAVILSSGVFQSADVPTWNAQTYVRVQDVTSVVVTSGFVAHWTAYTSCAMDFWDAGDIVLPPGPIEKADTGAYSHSFAGLGIKNSRLTQIPHGVFAHIDSYGLDLDNVSIPVLNLFNLVYPASSSNLQYLRLTNTVVGVIEGMKVEEGEDDSTTDSEGNGECCSINLESDSVGQKKKSGIWINHTRIGFIEPKALNLKSESEIDFSVDNSEIGMIKKNGVMLADRINPQILNTRVDLEGQGSILIDDKMILKASGNQIVLPEYVFDKWNCGYHHIENNNFIIVKLPDENHQESDLERFEYARMTKNLHNRKRSTPQPLHEYGTSTTDEPILISNDYSKTPAEEPSTMDAFIHPTCIDHNRILNAPVETPKEILKNDQPETSYEISTDESETANNDTLETETIYPIILPDESERLSITSNSTSEKHIHVHKGLAYIILASIGVLTLIVLVLVAILVFRKKRDSRDIYHEPPSRDRRPSLMYMPGSSVYGNDSWPIPSAQSSLH